MHKTETIARRAIATLFLLAMGLQAAPHAAQANSPVAQAFGQIVNSADASIKHLEQEIEKTLDDIGDNRIRREFERWENYTKQPDRGVTATEMKEFTISNMLKLTLPSQISATEHLGLPVEQGIIDKYRKLHALLLALEAWEKLRKVFAQQYKAVSGRDYQQTALLDYGGAACDDERFAYSTVAVSTTLGKAMMQVERDFAANREFRPGDLQMAVLTGMDGLPAGEAETRGERQFSLADLKTDGGHVANGQPVTIGAAPEAGQQQGEQEEPVITWYVGPSSGSDGAEDSYATDSGDAQGSFGDWQSDEWDDYFTGFFPCPKLNSFGTIRDGRLTYFTPRLAGYVPGYVYTGGTAKAHKTCSRTGNFGLNDSPDAEAIHSYPFRVGGYYASDKDDSEIGRLVTQILAQNGVQVNPEEAEITKLYGAELYGTVSFPDFEFDGGGCAGDASDISLPDGWSTLQYRFGLPATGAQLAASGVQLAALPAPEDRVQVAATASQALPNDLYFHSKGSIRQGLDDQWALKAIGFKPAGRDGAGSLWPKQATPVLVAVVDTGLDPTHPDIAGALYANPKETAGNGKDDDNNGFVDDVFGWNFVDGSNNTWDNNGHGTFIAGIIAARTDDHIGIAGVNPWARILPVKVTDFDNAGENFNLSHGIHYAALMGARVINVSVGGRKLTVPERYAIDFANKQGALVIVAAGNDGIDVSDYSPAGIPGAITVAATDQADRRAKFSNFGAQVDIAAPGLEVLSLRARQTDLMLLADENYAPGRNIVGDDGLYYHLSGTSFSAPFVAGVASLLFSLDETLTPDQVKRMILQSARDIEEPGFDWLSGYGLLDAAAALEADPEFYVDARLTDVGLVQQGGQNFLQPVGTAAADRFKRAWIEIGQGKQPQSWIKASDVMTHGVTEGALPLVGVQHFSAAGDWTFKLVVEHQNGRTREARYTLALN